MPMGDWFRRDFDDPAYFEIYQDKEREAFREGRALADMLGLGAGSRVLDLPCGWGRLRPALEARGCRVLGGDLSALNLARHHREHPGPIFRLDLRALPFREGCAHGVFCAFTSWGYFRTLEENHRQIREFARVLVPGGALLLDLAGRGHLERAMAVLGERWYTAEGGYRERARWSPDRGRILTDRVWRGRRFRHDIWIPTHADTLEALAGARLRVDRCWGGLDGSPWTPTASRWIYRAIKLS
jgi:SAM-dependent methyltransferase